MSLYNAAENFAKNIQEIEENKQDTIRLRKKSVRTREKSAKVARKLHAELCESPHYGRRALKFSTNAIKMFLQMKKGDKDERKLLKRKVKINIAFANLCQDLDQINAECIRYLSPEILKKITTLKNNPKIARFYW